MHITRSRSCALVLVMISILSIGMTGQAVAASAADLDRDSHQALHTLYRLQPMAKELSREAKAILVFPNIVKAGFVFGGSYGEGVMIEGSTVVDYYNSIAGSWGLQIGAQSYGYVVFLMTNKAVRYIKETKGWELGIGPTVALIDEGAAKNFSTSSMHNDAYAFIFGQQGLMAGISIEGTKISRIRR